jgi:hypothetical protein
MTDRDLEEYRALRATIRERGTARAWIVVFGLMGWAALTLAAAVAGVPPALTLMPLLVLAATFEAVFSLHIGVERIGRYLQVFHEGHSEDPPAPDHAAATGWEGIAMAFGRPSRGTRTDPLFTVCFAIAGVLNFTPALLAGLVPVEAIAIGTAHLVFIARLAVAYRGSTAQRAADLARFEQLKRTPG